MVTRLRANATLRASTTASRSKVVRELRERFSQRSKERDEAIREFVKRKDDNPRITRSPFLCGIQAPTSCMRLARQKSIASVRPHLSRRAYEPGEPQGDGYEPSQTASPETRSSRERANMRSSTSSSARRLRKIMSCSLRLCGMAGASRPCGATRYIRVRSVAWDIPSDWRKRRHGNSLERERAWSQSSTKVSDTMRGLEAKNTDPK